MRLISLRADAGGMLTQRRADLRPVKERPAPVSAQKSKGRGASKPHGEPRGASTARFSSQAKLPAGRDACMGHFVLTLCSAVLQWCDS